MRFENGVCRAVDGLDGTCYTRRQCSNIGGLNSGKCAQVGACCVGNIFHFVVELVTSRFYFIYHQIKTKTRLHVVQMNVKNII